MKTPGTSANDETDRNEDELRWVRDALGGTGTGPTNRYLVRPSTRQPELLIPLEPAAVTKTSMRRYHDDRSIKERATGLAGQAVASVGLLRFASGEQIDLEPFALVEHLALALGEPLLLPAVSLGPRRRNRKPVLQLVRPDGVSVGFAKVGWSGLTSELIINEGHWLRRVEGSMPPGLNAPVVLIEEHIDQPGGAIDVVVTSPLRTGITSGRRLPLAADVLAGLARVHGEGSCSVADLDMITQWATGGLGRLIDLEALLERYGADQVEIGMWHGDLTPWNTATNRGITSIWDWEFADAGRPVGFDAMHIAFELVRRQASNNEQAAVAAVIEQGPRILARISGPTVTTSPDAVIDLYLCELLARETRLSGEGWRPEHLGRLDTSLIETLSTRLRRSKRH